MMIIAHQLRTFGRRGTRETCKDSPKQSQVSQADLESTNINIQCRLDTISCSTYVKTHALYTRDNLSRGKLTFNIDTRENYGRTSAIVPRCWTTFENRNIAIRYYRSIHKVYRFSKWRPHFSVQVQLFFSFRSFGSLFLKGYSNNRTNEARRIFRATRALIRPAASDIALGQTGDLFSRGGERLRSAIAVGPRLLLWQKRTEFVSPRISRCRRRLRWVSVIVGKSGKRACDQRDRESISVSRRTPRERGQWSSNTRRSIRSRRGRPRAKRYDGNTRIECLWVWEGCFCVLIKRPRERGLDENRAHRFTDRPLYHTKYLSMCAFVSWKFENETTHVGQTRSSETIQSCFRNVRFQGRVFFSLLSRVISVRPISRSTKRHFGNPLAPLFFYPPRGIARFNAIFRVPFSYILPSTRIDLFHVRVCNRRSFFFSSLSKYALSPRDYLP